MDVELLSIFRALQNGLTCFRQRRFTQRFESGSETVHFAPEDGTGGKFEFCG